MTLVNGQVALLASDGYSRWFPLSSLANVGAGAGTYGPWIHDLTVDAQGRVSNIGVATPVTGAKANGGGALITGNVEFDGAGCVTTSEAGQIITITGRDGRGWQSYAHSQGS